MILTLCVDDRMGLSLKGRRLSKDAGLRRRLLGISGGSLRMSEYSARQFSEPVYSGADYLSGAGERDWCFCKNGDYADYAEQIGTIILFRWNRHYPADECFRFPGKWKLTLTEDFPGTSHETITMEVYERCN